MRLEAWLLTGAVFLLVLMGFLAVAEHDEWESFKASHECKAVAHIRGEVFNTFGFDSRGGMVVGVASTSDKTGWACNDGKTYYR
jgi:hypothetical protein